MGYRWEADWKSVVRSKNHGRSPKGGETGNFTQTRPAVVLVSALSTFWRQGNLAKRRESLQVKKDEGVRRKSLVGETLGHGQRKPRSRVVGFPFSKGRRWLRLMEIAAPVSRPFGNRPYSTIVAPSCFKGASSVVKSRLKAHRVGTISMETREFLFVLLDLGEKHVQCHSVDEVAGARLRVIDSKGLQHRADCGLHRNPQSTSSKLFSGPQKRPSLVPDGHAALTVRPRSSPISELHTIDWGKRSGSLPAVWPALQ